MARALCNFTSIFALLISDGIGGLTQRRGYAVAADVVRQRLNVEEKAAISALTGGRRVSESHDNKESAGPWMPDPTTGYYRPANWVAEVDAADLREALLKPRT